MVGWFILCGFVSWVCFGCECVLCIYAVVGLLDAGWFSMWVEWCLVV